MGIKNLLERIEQSLKRGVEEMGPKSVLRDACEYALKSGGKRLRPLLVLLIEEALGHGLDVMPAALSVEYFHTASLIADDLPCMDDDALRRGRPTLHRVFPESVAILASYTLIAQGYGAIAENGKTLKKATCFEKTAESRALLALEYATALAGLKGATQGQFLDLFPKDNHFEQFSQIVAMKTSSLFEIAFLFGWIFGGGALEKVDELRKCARHLGMAFQIADDLEDEGHLKGSNIRQLKGKKEAEELLKKERLSFRMGLESLSLWTLNFQKLFGALGG